MNNTAFFWICTLGTFLLLSAVGYGIFYALTKNLQYRRWRRWLTLPGVLVLTSAALLIFNNTFQPFVNNCSSLFPTGEYSCEQGTITMGGSTALKPLLLAAQADYEAQCPGAHIILFDEHSPSPYTMTGSFDGLNGVISGTVDIGSSDIFMADHDPSQVANYSDYQLAIVIYVIIVHKSANMPSNLSIGNLQTIYSTSGNTSLQWGKLGGPANLPVIPFAREETSGTQRTFEEYISKAGQVTVPPQQRKTNPGDIIKAVEDTPGAIGFVSLSDALTLGDSSKIQIVQIGDVSPDQTDVSDGSYPFWNIEHLYLRKNNPPKLAVSFINFLGTTTGKALIENHNYILINTMSQPVLDLRCP